MFHNYSRPAITFNGNDVVDEHFVTSFANMLFRLWKPDSALFTTFCQIVDTRSILVDTGVPKNIPRHYFAEYSPVLTTPMRDLSRLDGWSLCGLGVF